MDINKVLDKVMCSNNDTDWKESENKSVSLDLLALAKVNFGWLIPNI